MIATGSSPSGCVEGTKELRATGPSESIDVVVDFSLIVEVDMGSERNLDLANTLTLQLSQLAQELDTLGTLMGGLGAGQTLAGGVTGLAQGEFFEGTLGLVSGGWETYKAAADPSMGGDLFDVWVPTSPADAAVEVLKGTAQLGAIVSRKVGEWMQMNQLYNIRITFFYQTVTVTPHQVWECRNGAWVCVEKVFHYSVSGLQRRAGPRRDQFRLESDIARARFEAEINRMTARARSELESSARRKAEFDQRHRPGPC